MVFTHPLKIKVSTVLETEVTELSLMFILILFVFFMCLLFV